MSLGPCCISGHLHNGTPEGKVEKIAGLDVYVTGDPANKSKTILFVTDVFGYHLPNAQILADEYAKAGFFVYMPDILQGDPAPLALLQVVAPPTDGSEPPKLDFDFGAWLGKHSPDVITPMLDGVISYIKKETPGGKLGSVGFCWGAKYALALANSGGPVDAAVGNHPTLVDVPSDIEKIAKPVLINVGDNDSMMSVEKAKEAEAILEKKGGKVILYPGQQHGFAVRGDLSDENLKTQKEKAATETMNWFYSHLA